MKSSNEKEKKLDLALSKLKSINFENPGIENSIENLKNQTDPETKKVSP